MAQERLERLMNLIAYLSNTRKPLTLREIISTVPGYPDSLDAARRAFERDKEKLRAMNFDVAVENTPDGHSGYLIRKENTYYDIKLSAQQRSVVEYALSLYGPEKDVANNAVTKLGGMNPENIVGDIISLPMPDVIDEIFIAISENNSLIIRFRDQDRHVVPQRLVARSGYWYLSAFDTDKKEPRTFRVDRIAEVRVIEEESLQDLDSSPTLDEEKPVEIAVRVHRAFVEQFCQSWNGHYDETLDTVTFTLPRPEVFIGRILDYSGFVAIVSPPEIKSHVDELFDYALLHVGST